MLNAAEVGHAFFGFGDAVGVFVGELLIEGAFFCPGVVAADAFVTEAETAMVGVVVLLALNGFHGVGAGHGFLAWAVDGPEVGHVGACVGDDVFGKDLVVDFDERSFGRFADGDGGGLGGGGLGGGGEEEGEE